MEDPWSKDFSALSTIPGQLYTRMMTISNSPGLKIFNGIMTELNKNTGTYLKVENLTEILNDDDGQCYFGKNKLYLKQRTFKSKFDGVSTNFLWTKKLCDYFPENVEGYRDISSDDTVEKNLRNN